MRSLPCNGGDRSNLLRPSAGSEGLLTGEVRRGVLHRRLHQPRPLSASRQAYYPGHCFFEMIGYYLTPSPRICQFRFLDFLPYFPPPLHTATISGPEVTTGHPCVKQAQREGTRKKPSPFKGEGGTAAGRDG